MVSKGTDKLNENDEVINEAGLTVISVKNLKLCFCEKIFF